MKAGLTPAMLRLLALAFATCLLASPARAAGAAAGPVGAVGGVVSPTSGPLQLILDASDRGPGLLSATASLSGAAPVSVSFGGQACAQLAADVKGGEAVPRSLEGACPAVVSEVPLSIGIAGLAEGQHLLTVTVTDAAGETGTVLERPIQLESLAPSGSSSVTISLGTGATGSGGGSTGESGLEGSGGVLGYRISGQVPSYLALSLRQPHGLTSFPARAGSHAYTLKVAARVTASVDGAQLAVEDGEATSSRRGYLAGGTSPFTAPLEAGLNGLFQPLDKPFGVRLKHWGKPVANAPVTVRLRQRVGGGASRRGYHKLIYLTLSAQTP